MPMSLEELERKHDLTPTQRSCLLRMACIASVSAGLAAARSVVLTPEGPRVAGPRREQDSPSAGPRLN